MNVDFFVPKCQVQSNKKMFGLCDDAPPSNQPAYINETDGNKWIAVVTNEDKHYVTFTAIDKCIEILREDGKDSKRCDGVLTFDDTVIFVELKERAASGNDWVKDAERQLRTTIAHFEKEKTAEAFTKKKAYIANKEHPKFKTSQIRRMEQFAEETSYVLRIENRIKL
jgi:hypothetical protein